MGENHGVDGVPGSMWDVHPQQERRRECVIVLQESSAISFRLFCSRYCGFSQLGLLFVIGTELICACNGSNQARKPILGFIEFRVANSTPLEHLSYLKMCSVSFIRTSVGDCMKTGMILEQRGTKN